MEYNFIFPGVGMDYRTYVKESKLDQDPQYREYCGFAKELSGVDLPGFAAGEMVEDPVLASWCYGYTVDCLLYEQLRKKQIEPKRMLGYSMGLNTALKCAGSISYLDGINILKIIRNFKRPGREEAMVAFIGWEHGQVQAFIEKHACSNLVSIACENNPYCFILSGEKHALERLSAAAEAEGIYKTSNLGVDYAFHTEACKEPGRRLELYISELTVKQPSIPVISAVDQKCITTEEEVRDELTRNLYSTMKWVDTIGMVMEQDVEKLEFLEVSFGDALTKASRIMGSKKRFLTYDMVMDSQEEPSCMKMR